MEFQLHIGSRDGLEQEMSSIEVINQLLNSRDCGRSENLGEHISIQGVRGQSGFFDLVLTERNMQIKFDLRLSVYSLGVDI